ncbi:MAG: prepilin peptidase [Oscillatoriales cyanobacterium RM2_1_1]|nr:prepilin peptidase [Oscillatoriales cyanobacterium SM2_3_0]NJO45815.1 prepilin peptidase [Oscillatoriales cyanobacterium RM2_1_1]
MELIAFLIANLIVFVLGASIGSFLNVVIYRVPAGLSILHPPSRCPQCLTRLGLAENVPILGWLWLQGRCKHCRTRISPRYPIVEAVVGILFLVVFWLTGTRIETVGYWMFFSWLFALALIDLDTLTLPNALTQSGLLAGLGFQVALGIEQSPDWIWINSPAIPEGLITGILGAVVGIWLLDSISLIGSMMLGKTAMGAGDSKLAAMMGAWLGWKLLLVAGFVACGLGAFVGGGAIALKLINRQQPIPFGPFLAVGAGIAALGGSVLITTYLDLFFPLR